MAHGDGRMFQRGKKGTYWLEYYVGGKQHRESAKTTDPKIAAHRLKVRRKQAGAADIGAAQFVTPTMRKTRVSELLEDLKVDFVRRHKGSPQNLSTIKQAIAAFGDVVANQFGADQVNRYIDEQRAAGYRDASINRITGCVGQAFSLALKAKKVTSIPYIPHLSETGNARQGFCDAPTFDRLCVSLPSEVLQDFARFGFETGWRKGEIASLDWSNVQDDDTMIRLRPDQAKNGTGRSVPVTGELIDLIRRRREARRIDTNGTAELCRFVFHRDGRPIVEFRKAWHTACRKANIPNLIFHDLRRSAVTNMVNAHVPQLIAMHISGHKTPSMFKRYSIRIEDELRDAMAQVEAYRDRQRQKQTSSVKSIAAAK